LIVNVDINFILWRIARHEIGTKLGIRDSDNVVKIYWLDKSPVSSVGELTVLSSLELSLELVEVLLRDWVNCCEDVPVNISVTWWSRN